MSPEGRNEPAWLTRLTVDVVHRTQVDEHGGHHGVRDESLLESALGRPRNRWGYDEDVDLADLAASYAHGIARNHPFLDGNKRTAFMAAYTFLDVNGLALDAPEAEAVAAMRALSTGELGEEEFAEWLRRHTEVSREP